MKTTQAPTPLAPGYHEQPFWWEDGAIPEPLPERALPAHAEFVVVGGGYTGLAAAHELACSGQDVVLVEAGLLGRGASTRNGGLIHPGLKPGVPTMVTQRGQLDRILYEETVRAFGCVEALIRDEHIDCDYVRSGHLELAAKASHMDRARTTAEVYQTHLDQDARVIERHNLAEEIGTDAYYGALAVELSGALHPGRYFAGLTRAAQDSGAKLHEHTRVTDIDRAMHHNGSAPFTLRTERGQITANQVIAGVNGYADQALPALERSIVPINSYVITTEPLSQELAHEISPRGRSFFDTKNFLFYWRILPDNRMLFGGRTSFGATTVAQARDQLYRAMTHIHPQTVGSRITNAWSGQVGFTLDQLPHLDLIDGIICAGGYCGSGVALSTYFGTCAARWALGDSPSPFTGRQAKKIPLYRGNPWFLPAVGAYYSFLDRIPWS